MLFWKALFLSVFLHACGASEDNRPHYGTGRNNGQTYNYFGAGGAASGDATLGNANPQSGGGANQHHPAPNLNNWGE